MKTKTTGILLLLAMAVTGFLWQSVRLNQARSVSEAAQAQIADLKKQHAKLERPKTTETEMAELAELRRANETMKRDVARLRGQLGGILRAQSDSIPQANLQPGLPGFGGAVNSETSGVTAGSPTAALAATTATNLYLDAQIARASERLQLNPNQEQTIRDTVAKAVAEGGEHLRKVLSGEARTDEVPTQQEWALALEKQILAQLTPEQQAAYQKYKQEDISANARLLANGELLAVQNVLGLSQDQQDQAFAVFYEHAANELGATSTASPTRPREPLAAMEWQAEQKRNALEAILTPVQLNSYRRMQETHIHYVKSVFTSASNQPKP